MVLHPSGALAGALDAPPSKSATNRLLPIAALADGRSLLRAPLDSDDSAAMRTCLRQLGARVDERSDDGLDSKSGPEWSVTGTHGRLRTPDGPLDAQLSGTTMRFLAALATIVPGGAQITGASPLLRRPIGSLTAALGALGAGIEDTDGRPPVRTRGGGLAGGEVTVDVTGSSQFASAVLLVAPYAERDVTVSLAGPSATDYITLTVEAMRQWGAEVADVPDGGWHVTAGAGYRAREVDVEHDASAAAHLLALAAATGGRVTVRNASPGSRQPDAAVPSLLAAMGCRVEREGTALTVQGPARLAPLDADLGAMPDQVTTMAVLAALADGESRLSGVAVARTHETDRLAALATELGKLGIAVVEEPGALVIRGGTGRGPARLATYDDHRLAMAFASLGAVIPGITIEDPACVTKTYPAFWADAGHLGLRWAPEVEAHHGVGRTATGEAGR